MAKKIKEEKKLLDDPEFKAKFIQALDECYIDIRKEPTYYDDVIVHVDITFRGNTIYTDKYH